MSDFPNNPRRTFLKQLSSATALAAVSSFPAFSIFPSQASPNDKIRIAAIGMGIMGFKDVESALSISGVELAGVCDLYDGRLIRAKEVYGKNIITTKNYKELLDRKDIDAVIIATTDHWHDRISIDALNSRKHVYCEKPMVHHIEEGLAVIDAQQKSNKILQVGSQRVSSVILAEAKRLYEEGVIGEINQVEAYTNRHSALGAWQYSIPPDASLKTIDWNTFQGDAPKHAFEAERFFRWRNYKEYGTGVAGDLFVHLISGLHFIVGALGPSRVFSSGSLSYWKDGRNVPDNLVSIMDYPKTDKHPAFQVNLKVNFADGSGGGEVTRIIGTEGMIELGWGGLKLKREKLPKAPGYGGWDSFSTFPEAIQKEFEKRYKAQYQEEDEKTETIKDVEFTPPKGYSEHREHFRNFFDSIRTGKAVVEDAVFGLRAAGPSLAANESYFQQKVIHWDPLSMKIIE